MEDIKKVFTIQWVGPFANFDSLSQYLKDPKLVIVNYLAFITAQVAKRKRSSY